MRKRLTAQSRKLLSDCFKQQASDPYIRIGKHLLATSCKTTSSEAFRPITKMTFSEL